MALIDSDHRKIPKQISHSHLSILHSKHQMLNLNSKNDLQCLI